MATTGLEANLQASPCSIAFHNHWICEKALARSKPCMLRMHWAVLFIDQDNEANALYWWSGSQKCAGRIAAIYGHSRIPLARSLTKCSPLTLRMPLLSICRRTYEIWCYNSRQITWQMRVFTYKRSCKTKERTALIFFCYPSQFLSIRRQQPKRKLNCKASRICNDF